MASLTSWLVFVVLGAGVLYLRWLLQRERSTDRQEIGCLAEHYGLRVISVIRSYSSYNNFRYLFRGMNLSSTARFYDVAAEDFEGKRGDIHVAFDSLFGSGRLQLLETRGLRPVPLGGSEASTQPAPAASRRWTWYERLMLFCSGAGISGFLFSGALKRYLSPPNRPVVPQPWFGFTHLYKASYGNAYGTYFEYFVVTYGIWLMWGLFIASCLLGYMLNFQNKPREGSMHVVMAAAISLLLYYVIWQVSIFGARS